MEPRSLSPPPKKNHNLIAASSRSVLAIPGEYIPLPLLTGAAFSSAPSVPLNCVWHGPRIKRRVAYFRHSKKTSAPPTEERPLLSAVKGSEGNSASSSSKKNAWSFSIIFLFPLQLPLQSQSGSQRREPSVHMRRIHLSVQHTPPPNLEYNSKHVCNSGVCRR